MHKKISFLLFIFISILFAKYKMVVHNDDGTTFVRDVTAIDSITFVYEIDTDPILHVAFEDGIIQDKSPYRVDLQPTDVTFDSPSKSGVFNGTTSQIAVSHIDKHNVGEKSFSIAFWFKAVEQDALILSKYRDHVSTEDKGWNIQLENSGGDDRYGVRFDMSDGVNGSQGLLAVEDGVFDNVFHHICITVDRDVKVAKIYLDGALVEETSIEGIGSCQTDVAYIIGYRDSSWEGYFNGSLADLRVYEYALSDVEVVSVKNEFLVK